MTSLRFVAFWLWLPIACAIGIAMGLLRWGDTNVNREFSRVLMWGWGSISRIRFEVIGKEHLEGHQPCVYAANHRGDLDLFIFASHFPHRTVTVGKKELIWIPFFGLYFVAAGNVVINRQRRVSAISGLDGAVRAMRERKDSIWIFPEGTRNRTREKLLPFKKGAFYMAQQAGVPVVPVVAEPIDGLFNWKKRILGPGTIRIRFLPPVRVEDAGGDVGQFAKLVRDRMLEVIS